MSFQLQVHPEAQAWTPSRSCLARLRAAYPFANVTIRIWPRNMVGQISGRIGLEPYAFRAFTSGNVSNLFADRTETPRSICWLMGHELGHHEIRRTPGMKKTLGQGRPLELNPAGDRFHEIDPEEVYCDGRVSRVLGYRRDRTWWRKRVNKQLGNGSTEQRAT